jgi:hypothetical protein
MRTARLESYHALAEMQHFAALKQRNFVCELTEAVTHPFATAAIWLFRQCHVHCCFKQLRRSFMGRRGKLGKTTHRICRVLAASVGDEGC